LIADWPWVQAICRKKKKRPNPLVIPIDAVREISREAQYRPFQGKKRFFIVDEAEKMSEPAANAFLKTLEEPPETTHIILVTAFPDRLLPTILSRCQHFQFRSLTQAEMIQYLRDAAALEEPELTAAFSEGSIGRALTLDLEAILKSRDLMLGLVEAWIKQPSFEQVFGACEKAPLQRDLKDREKALDYLQHLATLGEDLYRVVLGTPERVVNRDRQELLGELASKISLDWIESFLYHVREACQDVRSYVNALVCFETLWLKTEVENAGSRQGQARDYENGL
jgi:DNA polymerase-3 subunit delta'